MCCVQYGSAGVYEDRELYKRAKVAVQQGRITEFKRIKEQLADYVLAPYLDYLDFQRNVRVAKPADALAAREHLKQTSLGERYFKAWLLNQGRRHSWHNYVEYYNVEGDTVASCYFARGLYLTGQKERAFELVPALWVVGESQPKECDPIFDVWLKEGHVSVDLAWKRLELAMQSRSYQLARYLFRFFPREILPQAQLLYNVYRQPRRYLSSRSFANNRWGRSAVLAGLVRLAQDDALAAEQKWVEVEAKYDFDEPQKRTFLNSLAFWLARENVVPDVASSAYNVTAISAITDTLISRGEWDAAGRWVSLLPKDELKKYKWRYWTATIERKLGNDQAAKALEALAAERTYYGFLAAFDLGLKPQLNQKTAAEFDSIKEETLRDPAIQLILELYAVDEAENAKQEWRNLRHELSNEQSAIVVQAIANLGRTYEAIFAANESDQLDLLDVRFPMPYLHLFEKQSHTTAIPIHVLLTIARQESAFNPAAVSSAGARGLMQLMLTTARRTARRIREARPTPQTLLDPVKNIRIGAHHLAELMAEYDENRIFVAAAYNAGSHNVNAWRDKYSGMPILSWIERIPFRETRDYVKNFIAISQVYALRMGLDEPVLYPIEYRPVAATTN